MNLYYSGFFIYLGANLQNYTNHKKLKSWQTLKLTDE